MKTKGVLFYLLFLLPLFSIAQKEPDEKMTLTTKEEKLIKSLRENTSELERSTTSTYAATVINTNFVVPIIRFNTVSKDGADNNQKGNISFFNSIGAGISINWGRLELTTDADKKIINREMNNTFGLQLGLLFAANSSTENNTNIFAPTFSVSLLNFQVGCGYELGTISTKENRFFYTLAYGIPVSKLVKGGFFVWKKTPLPLNTVNGFN
ncbi:hypothetical protein [Limnovirga soli]|uniref:Uncharacterized protein n=1 Tax=Limnovirga soli TaxID=2656915 RepID=A0A8J8FF29_9BACT|nr:hypothetical protein [Limnovirga soli]NNV53964.1 hypothetical protein [Limnovirga soli]